MSDFDATFPPPPVEPMPPAPTPAKHGIFMGRFGLRAGWGIAIFIVVWFIFNVIGSVVALTASGQLKEVMHARMQAQANPGSPRPHIHIDFSPSVVIGSDATIFLGMLALCFLFSKIERRPLGSFGIGANRVRDVLPGAFWGIVMLSAVVGVLYVGHFLVFDSLNLHGAAIAGWGIKWLIAFIFVGFAEEYALRGYVQYTLMRGLWGWAEQLSPENPRVAAFWMAGTFWSLAFAALHLGNTGENPLGIFQVFMAGMTFCVALWRTGSLWWAIGFHATWDWAQSFLFGVADSGNISVGRLFVTHPVGKAWLSGGPDGPEGSVFASVFLLLTIGLLCLIKFAPQPAIEQLPKEDQTLPPEAPAVIA